MQLTRYTRAVNLRTPVENALYQSCISEFMKTMSRQNIKAGCKTFVDLIHLFNIFF